MSLPTFPQSASITKEDAVNQIISSIALEEVALSHILNAEGEKIQYVLGTLEGAQPLSTPVTIQELLDINKSVRETMDSALQSQMFLKNKLATILNESQNGSQTISSEYFIPFAGPGVTTTDATGNPNEMLSVSFGQSAIVNYADPINIAVVNTFILPAAMTITSFTAGFSLASNPPNSEVFAQLYYSNPTENIYVPIPETLVDIGSILTTDEANKSITNSVTGLSVQLPAGTKLVLIFHIEAEPNSNLVGEYYGGLLLRRTQ